MNSMEQCRQHGLLVVGGPLAGLLAFPVPAAPSLPRQDGVVGTGGCGSLQWHLGLIATSVHK